MGVASVVMRRWVLCWSTEQSDGSGERGQMETEDRKEQPPPDGMSFSDNMAHPNIISSEAQVPEKKYDSVAELFEGKSGFQKVHSMHAHTLTLEQR